MKLRGLAGLLLAVVGAELTTGCSKHPAPVLPPPGVVVVPAGMQALSDRQVYVGQAVAYDQVDLVARVEGFLRQRNFAEGSKVKKGDLLFLIEQDNYRALLAAAKAKLNQARVAVRDADFEYNRHKLLLAQDANSKREFEVAETTKFTAEAKQAEAEANLETAQINLDYTEVRAPFDGRMGMAKFSVGNLVGPASGNLARIVRTDLVKIDFYVSEALIAAHIRTKVIVNQRDNAVVPRLILPDGHRYERPGTLEALDNQVKTNTGSIMVRAVFPNPDGLIIPGMYVKVVLASKQQTPTVVIPLAALQEDQAGSFVMVVDAGKTVHTRHVKLGESQTDADTAVLSGLQAGETVIVDGLQKVRDGMTVTPIPLHAPAGGH